MARLVPGPQVSVNHESIHSKLLVNMGVVDPDFLPTIFSMFEEEAPIISLLDAFGYKTRGVNMGSNWVADNGRFRTVNSNHVQFKIDAADWRTERFRSNADGYTYLDEANPVYTGLNKGTFHIWADSNFLGGNEIIILADGKTHLYCIDKTGGEADSGGTWHYRMKIDGNRLDEYVDPLLMEDGVEFQVVSSKYTQDFSTGGNERYTFSGFGDAYLTLQRFKYSFSGTAQAMDRNKKVTGRWVKAGNSNNQAFLPMAEEKMMKTIAKYVEFQILEGKGTVSQDTKQVVLTDGEHQEILSGSGIMYSGDGPIDFPINDGWNKKTIKALLTDIDSYIRPNENGKRTIAFQMHPVAYMDFQSAMYDMGVTADDNIEGSGNNKIINNTYAGYTLGGITMLVNRSGYLSQRPGMTLKDGSRSNEWDSIAIPLGQTKGGNRGIELIQLRSLIKGSVQGINAGGKVSNDIDGQSEHALIQVGVVSQVQPIRIYRPWRNNVVTNTNVYR